MRGAGPLLLALAGLSGCPLGKPAGGGGDDGDASDRAPRLVVAERAPGGGSRLVVVAENGDRMSELVPAADELAVDTNPAFSPDGRWVVFESSRGRKVGEMSLWIARARSRATPVRLTTGASVEKTPQWTSDGRAIVFASTRNGGFDLWRLPLAFDGEQVAAAGDPEPLTTLPGQELSPSITADGRIAFMSLEESAGVKHARIAVRAADGEVTYVTTGPADSGPAWTDDGKSIVFTAPHLRPAEDGDQPMVDGDLYLVAAGGGTPTLLVDAPGTYEQAPVFSSDGRWLFATSVFRSVKDDRPLMTSVVHVDRWEKTPTVHMLVDRARAVPRIAIAVAPGALDAAALSAAPAYQQALGDILRRAIEESGPPE